MDDWTSPVDIELTTPWTRRIPDLFSRRNLMNVLKESDKNVRAPKCMTPEPISASTPEVVTDPAEMFNRVAISKRKWWNSYWPDYFCEVTYQIYCTNGHNEHIWVN